MKEGRLWPCQAGRDLKLGASAAISPCRRLFRRPPLPARSLKPASPADFADAAAELHDEAYAARLSFGAGLSAKID